MLTVRDGCDLIQFHLMLSADGCMVAPLTYASENTVYSVLQVSNGPHG